MKETTNKFSRRKAINVTLGVAGLAAGGSLAAQNGLLCSAPSAPQALGPFFPRPGSPEMAVRENSDPAVPIYNANDNDLTFVKGLSGKASGQVVNIKGILQDASCKPIAGARIIIWQASETGRYNHLGDIPNQDFIDPRNGNIIKRSLDPNFQYWGQALTDDAGVYNFKTIVPGFYPADLASQWYRPPHIHFLVLATGFNQFVTQMYFRGKDIKDNDFIQELNAKDLLLQNPQLSAIEREKLVVDFVLDNKSNEQFGNFDLTLNRL